MRRIFDTLLRQLESGAGAVLCTVIARTGSAPRGAGAQMLVGSAGRMEGTIGGGYAERQAELHALQLLGQRRHDTRVYALHPEGGIGAVCGGEVTVHFAYIAPGDGAWTALAGELLDAIRARQNAWLALHLAGGAPRLFSAEECAQGQDNCFALPVLAGERAVIFGAGHCARALCPALAAVGFRVTVYDNRMEYAQAACFPQAESVICAEFDEIGKHLLLAPEDYAVVMTSGHEHDFAVLEQILRLPLAYAGAIGSRKKTAVVNSRLLASGIAQEAIDRLHAPIGLAIMAATPEEIAVSVAAEMILARAKRREAAGQYEKGCPMHG